MINIPYDCPRGREDCRSLSIIKSDSGETFFCCGENNGGPAPISGDEYTLCFKGDHRDDVSYHDKRDLVHNAAVIVQALAVIQRDYNEDSDWSAWSDL